MTGMNVLLHVVSWVDSCPGLAFAPWQAESSTNALRHTIRSGKKPINTGFFGGNCVILSALDPFFFALYPFIPKNIGTTIQLHTTVEGITI